MRTAILFLGLSAALGAAAIIDRIAVVVGKKVIKASDIDRDLRLTEFLNRESLDLSSDARRKAAERLIDQQIIRNEIAIGGYSRAEDAQAEALLRQILADRFGNSEARLRAELARYGLIGEDLRQQLLWQLTVLSFIQQRFQAGVSVSDEDVQAYYNQHLAELKREHPQNSSFEALSPEIRKVQQEEAVTRDFEDWLSRARQRAQIEYRQGAFQ
jgi:peptidyl-prolyl cis-trans isomerase SurA